MAVIPKIFLCYARKDEDRVKDLYSKLSCHGIKPWMDNKNLRGGDKWEKIIPKVIRDSDKFIVILSNNSVTKEGFLQKEIKIALDIGDEKLDETNYIIPVRIEECKIPDRLKKYHYIDLHKKEGLELLLDSIKEKNDEFKYCNKGLEKDQAERSFQLLVGCQSLPIPCFFPSISSIKTSLEPIKYIKTLVALEHPLFLVSAYDIWKSKEKEKKKLYKLLEKSKKQNSIILLDSGNYERYWLEKNGLIKKRLWTKTKLNRILGMLPYHLAFGFDNLNPPESIKQTVNDIENSVIKAQKIAKYGSMLPIIHARETSDFPKICKKVVEKLNPIFIAVPERELGEGIFKRAETILKIRQALKASSEYCPLHILGTGNPLSILIFAACGADSFDGLEWCQTTVDHLDGRLYHLQHVDFFSDQTPYGGNKGIEFSTRTLAHNLHFYEGWLEEIRNALKQNNIESLLEKKLPKSAFKKIQELLSSYNILKAINIDEKIARLEKIS